MMRSIGLSAIFVIASACAGLPVGPQSDGPDIVAAPADPTVGQPDETVEIATVERRPSLIEREAETYFASAEFPPKLQVIAPKLDADLRMNAENSFDSVAAMSKEAAVEDAEFFTPYGIGFTWRLLEHVEQLVSVKGLYYENFGGAHPNSGLIGLVYNTDTEQEIDVAALFADPSAAQVRLYPLVRDAIIAEKMDRLTAYGITKDEIIEELDGTFSTDGSWLSTSALVPSTVDGVFGGLVVYFSPYEIGAYAEGSYEAVIPQGDFRDWLMPDYAGLFQGQPLVPIEEDGGA